MTAKKTAAAPVKDSKTTPADHPVAVKKPAAKPAPATKPATKAVAALPARDQQPLGPVGVDCGRDEVALAGAGRQELLHRIGADAPQAAGDQQGVQMHGPEAAAMAGGVLGAVSADRHVGQVVGDVTR